jgi:sulfite exporter TauE/SafE
MMPLLTGLLLGVAGSGHCAAMCGPLVLTIGRSPAAVRAAQIRHALLYQAGRMATYVLLAVPAGLLGAAAAAGGLGRALAVAAGLLLLATALGSWGVRLPGAAGAAVGRLAAKTCGAAASWSRTHPTLGPIATGAANGLLPCGLVYAAAAAAAATGSVASASLLMLGFGLGTAPILLALAVSSAAVPVGVRARLRRLAPIVLAITAALLLVRGLAPSAGGHHAPPGVPVEHRH